LFNAKELDEETGLYYYGARYYDGRVSLWISTDPMQEKYPNMSSFAYCANNPILYTDPDGSDIVITGALASAALQQLQNAATFDITLTMDNNGTVCYTKNIDGNLTGRSAKVAEIIDNCSIIVNLNTVEGDRTSTGNLMVGGAFLGNEIQTLSDGSNLVIAYQDINPNVLGAADCSMPGLMILHETTEAYEGAKISQLSGISSPNSGQAGSVYGAAHNAATFQNTVYQTMYDKNGMVTTEVNAAVRVEWYVNDYMRSVFNPKQIIQTLE
jgi:RHS repeat-associated protein